ncbi:hypothetical protein BJ944DRAFT_261572 [Cunninghamella echinulata]|nr:hypothetical protein BJ944DRAFT_261572 [Cunninghamella echinulata]
MISINDKSSWLYITIGVGIVTTTSYIIYHIIEEDKQVKRKKQTRLAERKVLQLIHQIKLDRQAIHKDIEGLIYLLEKDNNNNNINENNNNNDQTDNKSYIQLDDKEWKRRDFILAECNELLIRLMERLDAIRPKSAILGDELAEQTHQPTELEEAVILEIRNRKRKVIRQIEQNFKQLDQCKDLLNHMNSQ